MPMILSAKPKILYCLTRRIMGVQQCMCWGGRWPKKSIKIIATIKRGKNALAIKYCSGGNNRNKHFQKWNYGCLEWHGIRTQGKRWERNESFQNNRRYPRNFLCISLTSVHCAAACSLMMNLLPLLSRHTSSCAWQCLCASRENTSFYTSKQGHMCLVLLRNVPYIILPLTENMWKYYTLV